MSVPGKQSWPAYMASTIIAMLEICMTPGLIFSQKIFVRLLKLYPTNVGVTHEKVSLDIWIQ